MPKPMMDLGELEEKSGDADLFREPRLHDFPPASWRVPLELDRFPSLD